MPLLLITNQLKKKFISQALNAGVSDFINEPLDELEIGQRIAVALKFQQLQNKTSRIAGKLKKMAGKEVKI